MKLITTVKQAFVFHSTTVKIPYKSKFMLVDTARAPGTRPVTDRVLFFYCIPLLSNV